VPKHGRLLIRPARRALRTTGHRPPACAISPAGAAGSRYLDLTPYPGLPAPIVASAWGFQLRLTSPTDPRLQEFVNRFRATQQYSPEYGGPCAGGLGTPLQT
jgi:Protein of unknown function (DUF3105)